MHAYNEKQVLQEHGGLLVSVIGLPGHQGVKYRCAEKDEEHILEQ
jgi:hypothetical protein